MLLQRRNVRNGVLYNMRVTQKRHSATGNPCHHWSYHRLTCDQYDELRARAADRCEICATPEAETGGKRLVVDHFQHGSVRYVRGMLCDKCNALMSCVDGIKEWGENRRWEPKAREYVANSWQQPTPEQLAMLAALPPRVPWTRGRKAKPEKAKSRKVMVPVHGPAEIAKTLRRHLSAEDITLLIKHLTEE